MMKNSFTTVLLFSPAFFLGQVLYYYFTKEAVDWSKAWEISWFQTNAIIVYWLFTK